MGRVTGADRICEALLAEGATELFGYPGGAIMPFYDALARHPTLRHYLMRHEQAAAHAADGYARSSGRVGVCVATSGPGASNLVTGLATAMLDSSPVVAITGQVPTRMLGRDAFQELDVISLALPVTKHAVLVESPDEVADAVHHAFAVARSGRPGPVLLDIPKDIQAAPAAAARRSDPQVLRPPFPPAASLDAAAGLLASAERPLILVGNGVVASGCGAAVLELAERIDAPIVTTLLGLGGVPSDHPLVLGMPGMHGAVHVNRAIQRADLLVAIGMRFDDRVTADASRFAPRAQVIHVEHDPVEIGKVIVPTVALVGDAAAVLAAWLPRIVTGQHPAWRAEIVSLERPRLERWQGDLTPEAIMAGIRGVSGPEAIVVTDVGQHQMWVATRTPWVVPRTHLTSGGLGTMGFAVPAAIGARVARPDVTVWAVSGDGGFQMNGAELATMVQEGVAVKLVIFNNGYLGMVRQWQELFHDRRYSHTPLFSPDYPALAAAYGIPGWRVSTADQVVGALERAVAVPGPALVEFVIEREANVWPMVPPGASLDGVEAGPVAAVPA